MKGVFEMNPVFPCSTSFWDVSLLFILSRKISLQSIEIWGKELAILLGALAGGQRAQTIRAIIVTDIVINSSRWVIPIYDAVKKTRPGKHMKPLEFLEKT